jgi:hypothetical protein
MKIMNRKTTFILALGMLLCLILGGIVSATGNGGSIWTTRNDCGDVSQDVNHYALGEKVYINGANFNPGTYNWSIKGNNGGSSCDPDTVVASGNFLVGETGAFCFEAYTIALDDCGEYKVKFNAKNDNYRIDEKLPIVPEFGALAAGLTVFAALGAFFLVRRK